MKQYSSVPFTIYFHAELSLEKHLLIYYWKSPCWFTQARKLPPKPARFIMLRKQKEKKMQQKERAIQNLMRHFRPHLHL